MYIRVLTLIMLGAQFAYSASAQGLAVVPGQWETSSQVDVAISQGEADADAFFPRSAISESCIRPAQMVLQPLDFAGPGCKVSDVSIADPAMSFVLVCERGETTFYGTMMATADASGTHTSASMRLAGRQPDGREVTISATTESHRTGPCL